MKIRDGFKFAVGWNLFRGVCTYLYEVCIRKNPKYTLPYRKIAAALKGEQFEEKEYVRDRRTGVYTIKNQIGFRIDQ